MEIKHLSNAVIERLPPGSCRIRDARLPIIAVPAKSKPRVSLYLVKRRPDKKSPTWFKLGVYPEIDWSTAKKKALQILAGYALGMQDRASIAKAEFNGLKTVGDLLTWYLQLVTIERNLSGSRNKNVMSIIARHLSPRLANVELCAVSMPLVRDKVFMPMYEKYKISYVDLVLRTLKQIFTAAHKGQLLDSNPLSDMTLSSFTTARVKPKKAAFGTNELREVISRIAAEPRWWLRVFAAWQLMYATRRVEVCMMAWYPQIDMDSRLYRLPETVAKNEKANLLPLTDAALRILKYHKKEKRRHGQRGNWLFPALTCPWRHISVNYAGDLISGMLGSGSGHDLRKLARSSWAEMRVDKYVGELLMNHKSGVLMDTYVQALLLNNCRDALHGWHNRLNEYGLEDAVCGK